MGIMNWMRALPLSTGTLALLVFATACGSPGAATTPASPTATTSSPTTLSAAPTTTIPAVSVSLQGCSAPPVTFSPLCEVVALVEQNHVAPPSREVMAGALEDGINAYNGPSRLDVPVDSFVCAVPDETFMGVCDAVSSRLERNPVEIATLVDAGIENLVATTLDPNSHYIAAELVDALDGLGAVPGVGVLLVAEDAAGSDCVAIGPTCPLTVAYYVPESPAGAAGIRDGDVIRSIDGREVEGMTLEDAALEMLGVGGSDLSLEVENGETGEIREIVLTRSETLDALVTVGMVGSRVGYIRLAEFSIDAPVNFHEGLSELLDEGADTIVLDLRDNPGGLVAVGVIIGSEFFDDGLILKSSGIDGDFDYPAVEGGLATSGRIELRVLVNGLTASAAEALAGVIQERGRGTLIGEATYGKDTVQRPFSLRNGGELRLTIAHWTTPSGASVAGGLTPDRRADVGGDLSIEEAVEVALSGG